MKKTRHYQTCRRQVQQKNTGPGFPTARQTAHKPLCQYFDPMLDLSRGKLPRGGGPWWGRLTGTTQMLLFLAALAPLKGRWREQVMKIVKLAALPVSAAQGATIVIHLGRKLKEGNGTTS